MSVFDPTNVSNGTFLRFVSIIVIGILTIMMGLFYTLSLIYHYDVPEVFGQILVGGVIFFAQHAGFTLGLSSSNTTNITTTKAIP